MEKQIAPTREAWSIGFSAFLLIAGCLSLAERLHWIPDLKWGVPLFLIVLGIASLSNALQQR